MGLQVTTAEDLGEARRALQSNKFSFCLTDMRLPDGNGLDLVEEISERYPDLPTAVITAHGKIEDAVYALKLGAFDFVSKPVDLAVLRKLVNTALKIRQDEPTGSAQAENALPGISNTALDKLIGTSPAIQQCKMMIAKLARSQAPVLVSGESGSGKELAAHLIHDLGPRADGPFIPGQLRRHSNRTDGKRVFRTHERQLYRRQRRQGRVIPGRRRWNIDAG